MAIFLLSESRLPPPSTRETLRGYLLPSCERSLSVRITRVEQANKVHLLSTLNAQQLRSDGNRSEREHSATLPADRHSSAGPHSLLGAHGSAVGRGDQERRLRAAHEQGQAEAGLGGSALC